MRFEALGPLRVSSEGDTVRLRPAHRRLVASLLLDSGSWVTTDTLVDRMWGESPPSTARSTLHVHLTAVRRLIPGVVATGDKSYLVDLTGHEYDIPEFSSLVTEAVTHLEHGHFKKASELAARATAMWGGVPFHELDDVDAARADRARLIELSTTASAALARALMLQGRVSESIAHLRAVVEEQPFNESMWEELIRAYYLAGRQVDALSAFNDARRILADEMGLEPGPRLRELEEKVLCQHPDLTTHNAVIPNNLPGFASSFVDRREDLAAVVRLNNESQVVTICGPPGVGKTRLAVETAGVALSSFPGGVWMARLAGARSESDLLAIVASAMSIPGEVESSNAVYRKALPGPALLILDNCEHLLEQVRALLAARPRGHQLRVWATSRTPLGVADETVWSLKELPVPGTVEDMWGSPALELLIDRARGVDPTLNLEDSDPAELLALCQKTGGLPLAIELAARWLPSFDLKGLIDRDLIPLPLPRHHDGPNDLSVRITSTLGLLHPSDQQAWADASIFTSTFTADAFGAVCMPGAIHQEVASTIRRLVDASLLTAERSVGGVSYRVLEPFRDFGLARMASTRRARRVRDRHTAWLVGLAPEAASVRG